MKNTILVLLCISFFIFSCGDKEEPIVQPEPGNPINLAELKEGQQSVFVRYSSKCDSLDELFAYTGDTLILEVIQQGDSLLFQETLTAGSKLVQDSLVIDPIIYPVSSLDGEKLYLPDRFQSLLFYFYGNDYVYLKPQHDTNLAQLGCRLYQDDNPFIGDDIGSVSSFEVGDIRIENKTGVSCVPMVDVDAYLIYDENKLALSHVIIYEEFFGFIQEAVYGWKLLEK